MYLWCGVTQTAASLFMASASYFLWYQHMRFSRLGVTGNEKLQGVSEAGCYSCRGPVEGTHVT